MVDKRALIEMVTKEFVDRGLIIAAGFAALKISLLQGHTDKEVELAQKIYFAGAQHLWASINDILEPGAEPTEKDLDRMTLIDKELGLWAEAMKRGQP